MSEANIYTALLEVYRAVEWVGKDGKIDMKLKNGGRIQYGYASEVAFLQALRPAMIEHGLVMFPIRIEDITRNNTIVQAKWTYKIHHAPSDTSIEVEAIGEGADVGDKAANKAATGALKYALRQAFLIPTGDDPDKDASVPNTPRPEPKPEFDPVKAALWVIANPNNPQAERGEKRVRDSGNAEAIAILDKREDINDGQY